MTTATITPLYIFILKHACNNNLLQFNIFFNWRPLNSIGNDSLHEISNDNGVRVVNFATSKNLIVKSTMFPHRNIHKVTWTSPDGRTHNQIYHILIDRRWHSSILEISNRFAALKNLDTEEDVNKAWETIRENIKFSSKESLRLLWAEEE
jgi:hypothetical protein